MQETYPLPKGVKAIIPACPGYFVVYPIWHHTDATRIESLYYEPVIAWVVTAEDIYEHDLHTPYTCAAPVCVDSNCIITNYLIQYPDGNLIDQNSEQSLMGLPPKSSVEYEERIKEHFLGLKNEED